MLQRLANDSSSPDEIESDAPIQQEGTSTPMNPSTTSDTKEQNDKRQFLIIVLLDWLTE
jgi:hypothetical protein